MSTIRNADQILVLKHGQVIERGNHEELVAGEGLYATLCRIQNARQEAEVLERSTLD